MTHPEELLLAGYVDRSLPEDERRAVAEHLTSCEQCREEVKLAANGRAALVSLPVADAPPIGWPSGDEAGRPGAASRSGPHRWYRALAGVAAAAALIVAVAVIGPNLGSSSRDAAAPGQPASASRPEAEAGGGTPALTPPGARFVLDQPIDYSAARLQALARDQATTSPSADGVLGADTSRKAEPDLLACLRESAVRDERLRAIIAARFEGTPAWIGVYIHRSAGGSFDRVVVRALERQGCRLLATAEAAG
jgi:putative zinc finger protein